MSIEEKIDQAKGAAKEGVGKLTGDKKIEKEGAAEKAAANKFRVVKIKQLNKNLQHRNSKAVNQNWFTAFFSGQK